MATQAINGVKYFMRLSHCGIFNRSSEEAERFYSAFLGISKEKEFTLSPELARSFFSVETEVPVLVFSGRGIKIEVFICPECRLPEPSFSHIGIDVDDLDAILAKAAAEGVQHIAARKGEKTIHFLKDFSGNLIEIRQS
jgi:predicted enzyme related to lactoylglutathione lyase